MAKTLKTHREWVVVAALIVVGAAVSESASGQVANSAETKASASAEGTNAVSGRLRSWELPPIIVTADRTERLSDYREDDRIGSYGQPRWTATRKFTTTRVYVVPEGKMEAEYWLRSTFNKDGTVNYRSLYEAEIGLPHRLQLDFYARTDQQAGGEVYNSQQYEVRYALADWGELPANPTLYLEWIRHEDDGEPNQVEPKLLLGGDICPRWHWGLNLVGEFQTGGELEREYSVRSGISHTLVDSKFAIGAESQANFTDTKDDRGDLESAVTVGPSFQYRPVSQMTVNFAPLFGVTGDSPVAQVWLNAGWEF